MLLSELRSVEAPDASVFGGKGAGLVRLMAEGFPVPDAVCLNTRFFSPWSAHVYQSREWFAVIRDPADIEPEKMVALARLAAGLDLSETQSTAINELATYCGKFPGSTWAVRSSAADEDSTSASFAGLYSTRLGVAVGNIEQAVRDCFVSAFRPEVISYRLANGLDLNGLAMAVVIQRQLDSDVAGVAFSLNPLNNDYDEILINSLWGQGEALVSGLVEPDQFVVKRPELAVVQRRLGSKKRSMALDPDGGLQEGATSRATEWSITDDQAVEVAETVARVEDRLGFPVDVEWAFVEGSLYLLQARPITRYIPLPSELTTKPGERRELYVDAALSSGFTLNEPISPLGLDFVAGWSGQLVDAFVGPINRELRDSDALWRCLGGRMYIPYSGLLTVQSRDKLVKAAKANDELLAAILSGIDESAYRGDSKPFWATWRVTAYLPRLLWRLRTAIAQLVRAIARPEREREAVQIELERYIAQCTEYVDPQWSIEGVREQLFEGGAPPGKSGFAHFFSIVMGALGAGLGAVTLLVRIAPRNYALAVEDKRAVANGYGGNPVVEMGLAFHELSQVMGRDLLDDPRLPSMIRTGALSDARKERWHEALAEFGHRGPLEVDLARSRYADDPALLIKQCQSMITLSDEFDPELMHGRTVERREQAVARMLAHSGWLRRKIIGRLNRIAVEFAGMRDAPKHYFLRLFRVMRERVMAEGEVLVEAGRLDRPTDVFDLQFADLAAAAEDPGLDLREIRADHLRYYEKLKTVRNFPIAIDSRGRVLRPPEPSDDDGDGVLRGSPLAPGCVRGPVKILHRPDSQPIEPGDILVAYTTDPGWTPLFVNAAAIVLEIGGALQHGAVVAREYGKPCVAGIMDVTIVLEDGQLVEVDGDLGTIRLLR